MGRAILHTIRSINPALGGPAEVVNQLSRIHTQMGCVVDVATLDAPGDAWVIESPLRVHALGEQSSPAGEGYGFSTKFVPWLKENRTNYDAVISHGLWQYNNAGVREALVNTGTPYFVFPHGMLDPWFKRAYPVKHLKKWIYWMLRERYVLRDAAAVLFTCEEERLLARRTFRPYRCEERVIPLGIEPPAPEDASRQKQLFLEKFPALRDKRILLFLGRLHDKKGCDMLIETFGKAGGTNGDAHLMLAGPCADDAYMERLQSLAGARCPAGSVSFPGMLAGDMKWGAFRAADVFVLPSHQENFGIAVVEALACGLPVLISNKVNIWREINADGAGLVQDDTLAGTAALLDGWRRLEEKGRNAMRAATLDCFIKRFQIGNTAHELLELIAASAKTADSPDAAAAPE